MTMRIIDIHKISCLLKINATPLIPMHHNNQSINVHPLSMSTEVRLEVLKNEKRMMDVMIFIDIHLV